MPLIYMVEGNDIKTDVPSNFLLSSNYRKPEFYVYYILVRLPFMEAFLKGTKYVKLQD